MGKDTTTIRVKTSTKKEFEKLGEYGESADDILNKIIKQNKRLEKATDILEEENKRLKRKIEKGKGSKSNV